jgi:opacity protein-like surface antigen
MSINFFSKASLVSLALLCSVGASAQVYVGIGTGQNRWQNHCSGRIVCDTNSPATKLFAGYTLDNNFAIEMSAFNSGSMVVQGGNDSGSEEKVKGFDLVGVYHYGLNDRLSVFGKAGFARLNESYRSLHSGGVMTQKTSTTSPVLGIGLKYQINKEIALRTEYEIRRVNGTSDRRVNTFTVGAQYSF